MAQRESLPGAQAGPAARPPVFLLGDSLILGGTEGQFVEIALGLSRSRWNVHVGCSVCVEGPNLERLKAAQLQPVRYGWGSFRSPRFARDVVDLARSLRARRIGVVHTFGFYSNILGILAARLARVPVVIGSQRDLGNLRPPFQCRVHRLALRLAGHIVVNTEAVAGRLGAAGIVSAKRIVVIPNGVDLTRFAPKPGPAEAGRKPVTVGTLAELRPEKAVGDLLRAARLLSTRTPAVRFVVWGDGPCRPELERLVRELGLSGVVEFRGATDQPEAALRDLDLFVLPSISEACPNALLEAMATGVPVIATTVGGIRTLIEDDGTGLLVPPGNPPALARAILKLLADPALASALAARAQERVRNQFGLDRMLARVEAFYAQALAKAHS